MIGGNKGSAKDRLRQLLRQWSAEEGGRFILWAPVLMIVGIALYFSLKSEPSLSHSIIVLAMTAGLWARGARARTAWVGFVGRTLFFVMLGFVLALLRTQIVAAPIMPNETVPVRIEGEVLKIENRPTSQRILLVPSKIGGLSAEHMPAKIRLTWRGSPSVSRPGDIIALRGVVAPPPIPTMPGGYDYGRQLYFEQIGGSGFAMSAPRTIWRAEVPPIAARIEHWRARIAARIMSKASPDAGPVLAAVVTGLRAQIPPQTTEQLRDTGLAHLLAISGLHMGLVCGFLFVGVRTILVWVPGRLAASYRVKKWAAVTALLGGAIYLTMSGGAWSAQRAFIMAAISFVAILFDRRAISLRNVAIAALIILFLKPEAALSAGFQMSFGAVMALVAAYEAWHTWRRNRPEPLRVWKPAKFLGGVLFTSFVAGMATSPFAIYHFGRIANFGLVANMAVMPLFTIGVMPIAVLGLMAMPLGLDAPFWWVSSVAFDLLLTITAHIADWRGAVMLVPQWPRSTWLILTGGMVALCLMAAPWRLAALICVPVALGLAAIDRPATVMISEDVKNVIWRDAPSGEISLLNRRSKRFSVQSWLEGFGDKRATGDVEKFGPCKNAPCVITTRTGNIIFARTEAEALAACEEALLVIAPIWSEGRLNSQCAAPMVTMENSTTEGPIAIWETRDGLKIRTVNDERGVRPWSPR